MNNKDKNGFLITWVSCIVVLLTLCFFGINDSLKGTRAEQVCTGGWKTVYSCSEGELIGSSCFISNTRTSTSTVTSCASDCNPCSEIGGGMYLCTRVIEEAKTVAAKSKLVCQGYSEKEENNCKYGSYGECMGAAGSGYTCMSLNGCWTVVVDTDDDDSLDDNNNNNNKCDAGHYTKEQLESLATGICGAGNYWVTSHSDGCYTYNCSGDNCKYKNESECESKSGVDCTVAGGSCYVPKPTSCPSGQGLYDELENISNCKSQSTSCYANGCCFKKCNDEGFCDFTSQSECESSTKKTCVIENGCWVASRDYIERSCRNGGEYFASADDAMDAGANMCGGPNTYKVTRAQDYGCYNISCCECEEGDDCTKEFTGCWSNGSTYKYGTNVQYSGWTQVNNSFCSGNDVPHEDEPTTPTNPSNPGNPGSPNEPDDDEPDDPPSSEPSSKPSSSSRPSSSSSRPSSENTGGCYKNKDTGVAKWFESDPDSKSGTDLYEKVDDSKCEHNITENPPTGQIAMFVMWVIGFAAIGYSVYYMMKFSKSE